MSDGEGMKGFHEIPVSRSIVLSWLSWTPGGYNGVRLRVATLALEDVGELRGDLLLRDRSEVESLQPREDRGTDLRGIGGAEDEDDPGWRLFEPLEQCVPGIVGESVHLVEDQHLPLEIGRRIRDQRNQIFADVIDAV